MAAQEDRIERQVVSVMRHRLLVPDWKLGSEYWDEPLTGRFFGFSAVDLTYLFFELERAFNVRFRERDLADYGYSTINRIVKAVRQRVGQPCVASGKGF